MANATSAGLNPIDFASAYHFVVIAGTQSPGVIDVDGVQGFERKTEWDVKKGKGTQGATLSLVQRPPCEGSFSFVLWLPSHFAAWEQFRPLLKFDQKAVSGKEAYDVYYPTLADIGIKSCVTKSISPIRIVKGRGLVTVEMIEYLKPPPKSIVSTPANSTTNANRKPQTPGTPPDPIADAQQKRIAQLMKEAADTPLG